MNNESTNLAAMRAELARVEKRREELLAEITRCASAEKPLPEGDRPAATTPQTGKVCDQSPPAEKVHLFRSLFRGREDIYPRRFESHKSGRSGYQPACRNEWVSGICCKPRIKCAACTAREFLPLTDQVVESHLRGRSPEDRGRDFTIGIYPMFADETCWLLAADFDKSSWQEDVGAFRETCEVCGVPVAVERSRSGKGAHAWIFFTEPVPCAVARKLGTYLITQTMERRPEIDFDSYDRLFPNQDTLPQGGFGNLIALPLQRKPRANGNSVFVDLAFMPYPDQWAYLSSVQRMSREKLESLVIEATRTGQVVGVRMPITDENAERPWEAPPSRKLKHRIVGPFPEAIELVSANQIFIPKQHLPPSLRNAIVRVAAFQNPEFYRKQAMRMPVWNVPRIISCAENHPEHIAVPRGCLDELGDLLDGLGIRFTVSDKRFSGRPLTVAFRGQLYPEQEAAAKALLAQDIGVLAATTAFGKTVVAAYVMARRSVNTLVLVHRRQLLDQWVARLRQFLDVDDSTIGQVGAGKRKTTGQIDVALMQSLCRKGIVDDLVANYGHLIIDECHHVSAPSFEAIAKEFRGRYVTGLSATVARKDGHHPIIFMNCGSVRYRVSAKKVAEERPFTHKLIIRDTTFRMPLDRPEDELRIVDIYQALVADAERNAMIVADVLAVLEAGRYPLLLTERRSHVEFFEAAFAENVKNLIVFTGGMQRKQLAARIQRLEALDEGTPRLILATGRFLGEGFDHARLDTLFLALPISWRGTLAQYAGRLHRLHERKREVVIYDYADSQVPMLARMLERRLMGYKAEGYVLAKG